MIDPEATNESLFKGSAVIDSCDEIVVALGLELAVDEVFVVIDSDGACEDEDDEELKSDTESDNLNGAIDRDICRRILDELDDLWIGRGCMATSSLNLNISGTILCGAV